jgi:gliding motility-associated-like protein
VDAICWALKILHLRNRILHIGFLIGLLFIGKVGLGQNVYITAPANVCKGKPFALEIHSDQPISFQLQRRSTSTGNNWQPIDKFTTVPVGSDNVYTYNPTITVTTEYQIWYTTDLNFDPAFPNLASPAPTYLPQIVQINLFPTPIVASITSSAVCSGSLFEVIPTPSDGSGNSVSSTYSWLQPTLTAGLSGAVAATNSGTISGTLLNSTNTIKSATYTVTPVSVLGSCPGANFTVTIPVKPTPTIAPKATTICSGGTFSVTLTDASSSAGDIVPAGTTYSWSAPVLTGTIGAVTGGMSGTGSFISGTLTNTTNTIQSATYTVTPTSADGCVGSTFTVTVTIKPRPNIADNNPPAICTGRPFVFTPRPSDIVPSNIQYTWTVTDNPNVNGESNVSTPTSNFSQVLNNEDINSQQVNYVVTPISDGCVGPTFNATVTLIPNPLITNPSRRTVCSGAPLSFTPTNGRDGIVPANTFYTWTVASNTNVTGQSDQSIPSSRITGNNTGNSLLNTTTDEQFLYYDVTSSVSNGCASTTFQLIVTVVPVANINSNKDQSVCSGLGFTVTPGPAYSDIVVPGTTYTWTYVDNPNVNGESGVSSPTSAPSIVQTLTNLTNTLQTVVYNVTSVATTCAAANFTITAYVKPKPTINTITNSICTALGFEVTPTNGTNGIVPAGTTYSWPAPTITGGLTGGVSAADAGTISGTLTNPTNAVQTATYSVTPKSAEGCVGGTFTLTVTVNPKATIASNSTAAICSATSFTFSSTVSDIIPVGTTYSWSNPTVTGGLTGAVSASGVGTISGTLINPTNTQQSASYIITPLSGTCTGEMFTMTVPVNPKATIGAKAPISCSGALFQETPANGGSEIVPAGTVYRWSNPTVTGGLTGGANATGASSFSGTLLNPTNTVQTATYSITPTSGSCDGAAFTATVTINPKPTIANNVTEPICSTNSFAFSSTTGDIIPVGTTYTWNLPTVTGGLMGGIVASGVTTINGTLTNPTNTQQSALYTITPTAGSCTGGTFTMSVVVNPKPTIADNITAPICSATSFTFSPTGTDVIPSNTQFTWATPTVTGGLTGGVNATASATISGTLTNPTNLPQTATYNISTLSGSCAGRTFSLNVTVIPKATIANNVTAPICSATSFTFSPTAGDVIPAGTSYSWTVPTVTGGLTGGVSATGASVVTGTLTNPTNAQQSAIYTITPLSGNCNGGTFTMSVAVNPLPADPITAAVSTTYSGTTQNFNPGPTIAGQDFKWYYPISNLLGARPTYVNASPTPYEVYVAAVITATGCESANKVLAQLTINKKVINAIASALNKVYDATTAATATVTSNEIIGADNLTFAFSNANFDNKNVGVGKTVTVSGVSLTGGTSFDNYTLNSASNTLTTTASITQKPMTVLAAASDKVYDGTISATVVLNSPDKIGLDDVVYAFLTANFNNKTAAINKLVTVTGITISGGDATNYTLTANTATTTATITKKELTVTGSTTANKIYDATVDASVASGILQGIISPDIVTLTESGTFDTKNVGIGKTVTSTSTIGGGDALNYYLTQPILPTANITAKTISVTGAVASNKIYDATVNATVTGGTLVGVYPIDIPTVNLVQSGIFADKNVNNGIGVTANCSLIGADAPNYSLLQPILAARNITPKELTMSGLTIPTFKVYDATTVATITDAKTLQTAQAPGAGTTADGKPYTGDIVSITGTPVGTYNSKDVPTATRVTFSGLSLTGSQAGNYTLKIQDPILATIVKKKLTMSGLRVDPSKVYDGTVNVPSVTGTPTLQVPQAPGAGTTDDGKPYTFSGGDDVRVIGIPTAVYNSKNVVEANRVIFSGLSLDGAHKYNYELTIQSDYAAIITPKIINVTADPKTKVYGEMDPPFTYVHDPIILGDAFTGGLSRELGQNVASYPITQGSLDLGTNYTIIYQPNNLVITEASLYLKPDTTYRTYGDAPLTDGFSTTRFIVNGLQYSETITNVKLYFPTGLGSGNDPKDPIGLYSFGVVAKDPSGGSALPSNYKIVSFPGDIRVKPFPITITAEAKVKRQSQVDPPLTYVLSTSPVNGDLVTGALVREPGDEPGTYPIRQGTVLINDNYDITYVPNLFTVLTIENIFVLPNAFTPNGDGLNDVFKILYNSSVSSINYFRIYNKAGRLVFETKNIDEGWDGRLNGLMQDSDAFYWVAEYVSWNNKIFQRKGSVVLLK